MKVRRIVLAIAVAGSLGLGIVPNSAAAYCQYETPDGGCSNSCTDTGKIVNRLTKGKVGWDCPQ